MDKNSLKEILLKEHDRDKNFTYLSFALYGVVGIVVAFLLLKTLLNGLTREEGMPLYYKLIIPIAIIGLAVVAFKKVKAISSRHIIIEDLFNNLNEGKHAIFITPYTEYKISVNLGRINIKMFPINFLSFSFQNQIYKLPVPLYIEPEFKTLLSGANLEKVTSLKAELNDGKLNETTQSVPLKTIAEFTEYADKELSPVLENMESNRKKGFGKTIVSSIISLFVLGGFVAYYFYMQTTVNETNYESLTQYILIGFGALIAASFGMSLIFKKKNAQGSTENPKTFKEQIFKKIITFINPSFQYVEHGHLGGKELFDLDILQNKKYDISGNDQILGVHNGVPFQYCDLYITHTASLQIGNESATEVFSGQFFVSKFNKALKTQIVITPKSGISNYLTTNAFTGFINRPSDKIILEDPEFTKMFDVYADDQIQARYILTPTTMQNIKDVANKTKGNVFLFFVNNKVIVANNNRKNNFETNIATKLNAKLLVSFYEDLYKQFSIIDDLKLNVNIWKQNSN